MGFPSSKSQTSRVDYVFGELELDPESREQPLRRRCLPSVFSLAAAVIQCKNAPTETPQSATSAGGGGEGEAEPIEANPNKTHKQR